MDFDGYKNEQTLIRDIYKIALNALVAISCKVIEAPSMKSSEAVEALDAISSEVVAISRDVIASIQKTAQRRETRALELQSLL